MTLRHEDWEHGISGGGSGNYFFRYEFPDIVDRSFHRITQLNQTGLTPQLIRRQQSIHHPERDLLIYERIRGYNFLELPESIQEQTYTNGFAKNLAQLFIGLQKTGFIQEDAHPGNYMIEEYTGKLYVVDDEGIRTITSTDNPIREFANLLLGIYLHESPLGVIMRLNRAGRLHTRRFAFDEPFTYLGTDLSRRVEETEALMETLRERGLAQKVDPALLQFISDNLISETPSEDFERVLALK